MNRDSFAELLHSITIPSNMPIDQQQNVLATLVQTAHSMLPERLYRFRACSELSIGAFDKDELWASTADCMNDGFDTRIYIDTKEIKEQYKQLIPQGGSRKAALASMIDMKGLPPLLAQWKEEIQTLSEEEINKRLSEFSEWLMNDAENALQQITSAGQQAVKICCFSENIKSPAMWGLYAADETGFALEYDFSQMPYAQSPRKGFTRECSLFPVIYSEERYKVSTQYVIYLLQYRQIQTVMIQSGLMNSDPNYARSYLASGVCPDNLMPTKISLHKSKEWERETEWRLFVSSINDGEFMNAKHGCCIKKPTAIYLGRRIKPINEKILRKLAEEKSIPVFKMKLDDESPTYDMLFV